MMRARAALAVELETRPGGGERTRISGLRSQSPLLLRPTLAKGLEPWTAGRRDVARVCVAAGAAGPLGGDRFALSVDVGAGSTLVLRDVSATLLLPGPHGEESRLAVDVRVGAGATLVWLPEAVIAARGCRHVGEVNVALEPGARLILREELLLGRHGEQPGSARQHVRVRLDGRPLLHQQLAVGPDAPGYDGPAVTGAHRAIGSVLVVDPAAWSDGPPPAVALEGDAAVMPLEGPAVLVSALGADAPQLRRTLDAGLALLDCSSAPPDVAGAALAAGAAPA